MALSDRIDETRTEDAERKEEAEIPRKQARAGRQAGSFRKQTRQDRQSKIKYVNKRRVSAKKTNEGEGPGPLSLSLL